MQGELTLLLEAETADADYAALRRLVLDDNVLLKQTDANRQEVFYRLTQLYGLRLDLLVYRVLHALWIAAEAERPMLVMLCAAAREPLLRATADFVLEQPTGGFVTPQELQEQIEEAYPDRFSLTLRKRIGQHLAASWAQSGHLAGKARKTRCKAHCGPASVAFALLLGHLCGARGVGLFTTVWARLLDASPSEMDALAFAAAQRGWLDYRRIGDVADIGFSAFLPAEGE